MSKRNGATAPKFDKAEVVRAVKLLAVADGVVELRTLQAVVRGDRRKHKIVAGYFDDANKLAEAVASIESAKGIYVTLNPVRPDLLARYCNRLEAPADKTTADADVTARRWVLIDVDAVRPSDMSATNAEHEAAIELCRTIYAYLKSNGWAEPLAADSGNGGHLLYRIDLPSDDGGLVQRCLQALATRFDNDNLKVDTSVHNPARIVKLYGTLACKGDQTGDRVHRPAKLLSVPEAIGVVPRDLLESLAAELPAPNTASGGRNAPTINGNGFVLEEFVARHFPEARGPKPWNNGGTLWTLPTCPFNADHANGEAYVGRMNDGKITAGCHHNSCQHWTWHDLRKLLEPRAERPRQAKSVGGAVAGDGDGTIADRLVDLALERYRFGRTNADEPFAVEHYGPNVARLLRGNDSLRQSLAKNYRREHGRTPNASALADAVNVLAGEALDAEPESVALRVAEHDGGIVYDLARADGKAVVVTPAGWNIVDRSPVLFRRTGLTAASPLPEHGGRLDDLRQLLNVSDESWSQLRGWLVAGLIPSIPHPILMLGGIQGTGKSTALRLLSRLIDPSEAQLRTEPRDPEQWAMAAAGSWCVALDNVSHIPPWLSDALCKAVTGDGWIRRKLYHDSDLSVLNFRRVAGISSIDPGALRGDLADRLLLVELEAIDDRQRRSEAEILAEFERQRAKLFGALLTELVAVLSRLPVTNIERLPRMADFAKVLAAMDDVADDADVRALPVYLGQGMRLAAEVVDSDPVAVAIVAFIRKHAQWIGTAEELRLAITPEHAPREWPKSPQAMAGRLKRLIPALKAVGIEVVKPDADNRANDRNRTRQYTLREFGGKNVQIVQNVRNGGPDRPAADDADDADDVPGNTSTAGDESEVVEWSA